MTKSRERPIAGASRRSSRAQSAWNVEIHMPPQSAPSSASTRAAHLLGRLVREGDRQDLVGLGVAVADEVGDAARDDARLARAGAGQNQQRPVDVQDGVALLGIEGVEEVHRCWDSRIADGNPWLRPYSTVTLFARFRG